MKTTVKIALAAIVAGSTLAITSPADAQTTDRYNHALVKRYGCSTNKWTVWHTRPPLTGGWLVTDFFSDPNQRWVHIERTDYPLGLWSLIVDDLHPQAVCKR
jgi:hypothetical protein